MTSSETRLLLREATKIVDALGKTLAPFVEVVLHDLTQPEHGIVAIANNLSGREIGDPTTEIGMARIADPDYPEVLQNYPNRFPDGRPAKSTSIGLKNSEGQFVAAICLNMDISTLNAAAASLSQLTQIAPLAVSESLAPPRLEALQSRIEKFAAANNTTPRGLSAAQRRKLVHHLDEAGLMELKNAQAIVADMLGVARSTVYTYLPKGIQHESDSDHL
jgi:predicted transcriptional regulator YheO